MCYSQFSMIFTGGVDFCKSGKKYSNAETCKLYTSSVHNFETFGILCTFPSVNIAKVIKAQISMLNPCVTVKFRRIQGCDKYLCKLGKEYLNALLCKFGVYSLQHSETSDVSHVFLPLTIAEFQRSNRSGFWPTAPPCRKKFPLYFTTLPRSPYKRIYTKFCTESHLADIITCIKFFVDQLMDLGSVRGRILPFSIDLAGRH